MARAKAESQRLYDSSFETKVYLVRDANSYAAAKDAVEMGTGGEVFWLPPPVLTPKELARIEELLTPVLATVDNVEF